ncbi:MAG: DEAD/DEAH box helicase [Rhodothermaceae bacterium]|nr:DEAD/DEAH box helicase [Rhodothermaceae bacterium]
MRFGSDCLRREALGPVGWIHRPRSHSAEATPLTTFASLDLRPELVQTAADLGFETPTPIQAALIPVLLEGRDAIGQAQTGTGKTAAFGLPLLHRLTPGSGSVQALVLVPTRELAVQVASALYTYGKAIGSRVLPVYGGQPYHKQINRLKKGVDVVVGTPGRLLDLIAQGALDLSATQTVVLDEADEMLSMGFVADIEAILDATPTERQTALLSATMPGGIRRLAERYLRDPASCTMKHTQRTAETVEQRAYLVHGGDKMAALVRLLETEPLESALIFTHTRVSTAEIASTLASYGYAAEALSGEMTQAARTETLGRFRSRRIQILVGTDVAARGLDIDHISHVINYDLPRDPEVYVHRIGRTGRAGKSGVAMALVRPDQRNLVRRIEGYTKEPIPYTTLPTIEAVEAHRFAAFRDTVTEQLSQPTSESVRSLILALLADGHEAMDIAAAALTFAHAAAPAPPLERVGTVKAPAHREPRHGKKRADTDRRQTSREGREEGMVRLSLDKGYKQGVRPNQIVSTIARTADIPGRVLGKILIENQQTLVDVPEEFADRVLAQSKGYRLGKDVARIARA